MGQRENIAVGSMSRASRFPVRPPEVLTATRVITGDEIERFQVFVFGPNVATQNVDLPPAAGCAGVSVVIANLGVGTSTLTVRDSTGAAVVTVPITAAGARKAAFLWCDGTAWYGLLGA